MVGLGHQQHATHEVCGGHTLGAFALSVPPSLLHFLVGISAIYCQRDVIAMNAEVTVVLVQCLQCGDVGSSRYHFIHPLDGLYHLVPLLLGKHRGPLMLGNLLVSMHAHDEVVPHGPRLA